MPQKDRPVSVRMSEDVLDQLQAIAVVKGTNLGAEMRAAAAYYIEQCLGDDAFQEQIEEAKERELARLALLQRPDTRSRGAA